ncbi:MAG: DUF2207 domain-containing protein [Synergistaceae bacterium]|jgi:uncharacterized membrane protein YgcG|nr:DUF2207 domain-containing protein [Synergistaceae bacterium]
MDMILRLKGLKAPIIAFAAAFVIMAPLMFRAEASERIMEMNVTASIGPDSVMLVHETIKARVEGFDIRRGIIRSIPTDYSDSAGRVNRTGFELVSALIDGSRTGVQLERSGRNVEVRIGDPDRTLPRGTHVFEITYKALGWVAFRESYDELYWNATGDEWTFPIDHATFRLTLPGGADILQRAAFTGRKGERGGDFNIRENFAETTRTLSPGEGFTVAFAWKKGFVTPPAAGFWEAAYDFITSNSLVFTVLFVTLVFVYYAGAWYIFGRDPEMGVIIPLYRPPKGIEPGFARYLRRMEYSDDCMAADIIQLAIMGYLYFEDENGKIRIVPTPAATGDEGTDKMSELKEFSEPLHAMLSSMIAGPGKHGFLVDKVNGGIFQRASMNLKYKYEANGVEFFSLNKWLGRAGLLLFIPFAPLLFSRLLPWLLRSAPLALGIGARLGMFASRFSGRISRLTAKVVVAVIAAVSLFVLYRHDPIACAGLAAASLIAFGFSTIMPARTAKGARIEAEIEGLSMYMNTAERHRLAMLAPPDETPQLFEALLPYAFALDCAETWANGFAETLKKASYRPDWDRSFAKTNYNWFLLSTRLSGGLSGGIRTSIADHAASLRTTRSSYSGGSGLGGGGHSGGGGGGGGGRGW